MNRASTVPASISRALNRKALSGGNGSTCAAAGQAAKPSTAAAIPATSTRQGPLSGRIGFRRDPGKVGRQSIGYGDSNDFRKFVGVVPADGLFNTWIESGAGLDGERDFGCRFDFAAPVIE